MKRGLVRAISALMAPLQRRVMLLLSRAVVQLVRDTPEVQEMQLGILRGEIRDGVERLGEYGLTSVPLPGAWALVACIGGNRDHPVVVATEDGRHRPTGLAAGEVALYSSHGQIVHLKASGEALIETPAGARVRVVAPLDVRLEAPLVLATGNVQVQGTLTVDGASTFKAGATVTGPATVTGTTTATGDLSATGSIGASGNVSDGVGTLAGVRGAHNFHDHNENDAAPAPTQGPNTLA